MTIGDILMAPFFERLCVLKEYRGFEIPDIDEFHKFNVWKSAVMNTPAVY